MSKFERDTLMIFEPYIYVIYIYIFTEAEAEVNCECYNWSKEFYLFLLYKENSKSVLVINLLSNLELYTCTYENC